MKIAFCISGETREHNKFYGPDSMITYLMELGHTVDVFGHTWDHCEAPKSSLYNFKLLQIDNQHKLISDWTNVDLINRAWFAESTEVSNGVIQSLDITNAKIGQHVSGWKCLQMPHTDQYDVFYRWRWDLTLDRGSLENERYMIDKTLIPWLDYAKTNNKIPIVITDNCGWISRNISIQDQHFFLNKLTHQNIKQIPWETAISNVWHRNNQKCSYHMLWNWLLMYEADAYIGEKLYHKIVSLTSTAPHNNNEKFELDET
jgi:hypothetical protein